MASISTTKATKKSRLSRRKDFSSEIDINNALPIYVQLVTMFRSSIESEKWAVGDKIPTLEELAEEFGVARATVRQAIGLLVQEGLIERHRGRGTHVIDKPRRDVWYKIPEDWDSLIHVSDDTKAEWLVDGKADAPPQPSHPGAELAPLYQYVSRLHRQDGVPYLIASAHFDKRLYRRITRKNFNRYGAFRVLDMMEDVIINRVEQTVVIGMANLEVCRHLEIPFNSPIAIVRRSVVDDKNTLICESEGTYRGDFVRMETRLI